MHVFWDGYGLGPPSGIATYGENLLGGLKTLAIEPEIVVPPAGLVPKLSRSKPVWPRRVARLVAQKAPKSGAVLHGLSNFNVARPRGVEVRTVLTVHDLIPFLCPEGVSPASYWQLRALLPRAIEAADIIVCVSEWTRANVAERYPKAARKLRVVRHGIAAAPLDVAETVAPPTPTLFYQARGESYKQISLYLDIAAAFGGKARAILLTDRRGREAAARSHPRLLGDGRVEVFDNVSNEAYEALFARADVYVHTSRYEGYCLPAADALRHALPVVYQAGSATDELLGREVGTPIPPESPLSDWVGAVNEAIARKGSPAYLEKRKNRLAALPSWNDTARAHAAIYSGV